MRTAFETADCKLVQLSALYKDGCSAKVGGRRFGSRPKIRYNSSDQITMSGAISHSQLPTCPRRCASRNDASLLRSRSLACSR